MNQQKQRVELFVDGISCAHCTQTISRFLKDHGAEDIFVDLGRSRVSFTYNHASLNFPSLTQISASFLQMGFKVLQQAPAEKLSGTYTVLEIRAIIAIIFSIPLLLHMFLSWPILHSPWFQLSMLLPVLYVGFKQLLPSAIGSIKARAANMDVLILLGCLAALTYSLSGLVLGLGHQFMFFETAATIIAAVLLGNVLEQRALKSTSSSMIDLYSIQPKTALRLTNSKEGQNNEAEKIEQIDFKQIAINDILVVNQGDRVPVDGTITQTGSNVLNEVSLDESLLTGESRPIEKTIGDKLTAGSIVIKGNLYMRADAIGADTVLSKIIRLIEDAQGSKPSIQRLSDKISSIFIPLVMGISLLTFLLNLILGLGFQDALLRAIAVLVVACPCAMGLATPTAIIVGLGNAARKGIVIKGASILEELGRIKLFAFDKTGTLTEGNFVVSNLNVIERNESQIRSIVLALAQRSSHPISKSLALIFAHSTPWPLKEVKELNGLGVEGSDEAGSRFKLGSKKLVSNDSAHDLYLLENDRLICTIDIEDRLREDALQMIQKLNHLKIKTALVSGDRDSVCQKVAERLGIKEIYSEQTPAQKVALISKLSAKEPCAFVGDGINDAAALSVASVGISLGSATAQAIDSAQVVLLGNKLNSIVKLKSISSLTLSTIKQNLFWAFFYNILTIPLAAMGYLSPTIAAFSMVFSDLIVVANSIRLGFRMR